MWDCLFTYRYQKQCRTDSQFGVWIKYVFFYYVVNKSILFIKDNVVR